MSVPAYPEYRESGVEWLGAVPKHWDVARCRFIFEIKKRIAGDIGYDVFSITQNGIRVKNLESNDGQLSEDYSKYQLVMPGDFAMNHMDLLTGGVDIADSCGVTSPDYRVCSLRDGSKDHSRYFLYVFVNAYRRKIFYGFGQGASQLGRWRLPTEQFNDFLLPRPPLAEQSAIAAFLDRETGKIDALVAEQERLMALLKEKRQAVISQAVTKGLNPNAPMRDSGVEWLGEVPERWEVKKLFYTAFMQEGPGLRNWQFTADGVRVICVTNITDNGIDFSRLEKFISDDEYKSLYEHFTVERYDILISSSGNTWGKVAVFNSDEKVILNTSTIRMHDHDHSEIATAYLPWLIGSAIVREQLGIAMTGSCQPNFGPTHLKEVIVPVPPISERAAIARYLQLETTKLDGLTLEVQSAIALLKERRAALISAAVTGKIDVRGLVETEAAA